jgi:hypothetical protein
VTARRRSVSLATFFFLLTTALGCASLSGGGGGSSPAATPATVSGPTRSVTEAAGQATHAVEQTSTAYAQETATYVVRATLDSWDQLGLLPSSALGFACGLDSEGKPRCDRVQPDPEGDLVDCGTGEAATGGGVDIKRVVAQVYRTSDEGWLPILQVFVDPLGMAAADGMSLLVTTPQGTFRVLAPDAGAFEDTVEAADPAAFFILTPTFSPADFVNTRGASMDIMQSKPSVSADEAVGRVSAMMDGMQVETRVGAVCDTLAMP